MSYSQLPPAEENKEKQTVMGLLHNIKRTFVDERERDEPTSMQSSQAPGVQHRYKKPLFTANDMEHTFLTLDKSLLYVGDNSTFQKRITLILAIQWISFSFMVNSMAYFFRSPNFSCRIPLTDIFYTCSQNIACKLGPSEFKVLQGNSQQSIVQEFSLYCSNSSDIYEAEGLFFLGGFLSGYILSYISERIGRRPVIMGVLVLSIISMVVCAFAPSFEIFRTSYFFTGCFLFGYETEVYLYISQISAVRFKTISINMLTLVWAGTPIFLPLLGFIPTWRFCFLLFALIWLSSLPFAYFCFLQSPRFLLSKKCYSQVREIFKKISITNNRPPYRFKLAEEMEVENEGYLRMQQNKRQQSEGGQAQKNYNYLDLFRYKSVKKATLVLMYLWMLRFFIYFGLNLALQSVLNSGFWLTLAIATSSFSEVIGTFGLLIIRFLFQKSYTSVDIVKRCLLYLSIICALLWFPRVEQECAVFDKTSTPCLSIVGMILLVCAIKFINSIFFSVLISYSSEAFPTVVRSLGYGFTLNFGRMSTFIVPFFINYMRSYYEHRNALCFMAPFGFVGLYLCFLMPRSDDMTNLIEDQQEHLRSKDIELAVLKPQLQAQPGSHGDLSLQISANEILVPEQQKKKSNF